MKQVAALLLILFLSTLGATAQISVKSFQALPMDMTATSLEGKRIDQNGATAALIKIVTSQTGFAFDGGTLGIVDSKQMVGEIWVWVPYGSRKITISHQQLGVLREYRYPIEIESERTYEMVLTTAKIETIVKEEVHEQFLTFEITPHDAVLEVNDQQWTVSATGSASKMVNFGTYSYRVQALNYHPDAGRVTVDDPDNTTKVTINLKPNFGWIEVPGNGLLQGAAVYVDNSLIGKAPCKSEALKSGQHNIRIIKELYEPYTSVVTVNDNETTTINPNLTADFAHVTLQVDADAEIWVNNELKGTRSWSGDLSTGVYRIECKLPNHETSITTKEVTNQMNGDVIQLEAPRPIYGSLMVESEPTSASIFIDGKEVGETPKFIKEILIGQHEIQLVKNNCRNYTETITIRKGERGLVNATMDITYEKLVKQGDEYYKAKNYTEALRCYREAAENGDAEAQYGMGNLYYNGSGVDKNDAEALKWYNKAADQGNAKAINMCARIYATGGLGVTRDTNKALSLHTQAGDLGLASAYAALGSYYKWGSVGFPKDETIASQWYKKAVETSRKLAEKGDVDAQFEMAGYYRFGLGVDKDWSEAAKWYRKAEEQGHQQATQGLGYCYCLGLGVSKNEAKAEELFRKGSDEERASEYRLVGTSYNHGLDVPRDYQKAMQWYRKAADLGNLRAYVDMANLYRWGHGVEKNAPEAERLFLKAAESDKSAWFQLGLLYHRGDEGVDQDYTKAMYWYRKSADGGNYVAQFNIGQMYEKGEGVTASITEAKKWYKMAADKGYDNAIEALNRLK